MLQDSARFIEVVFPPIPQDLIVFICVRTTNISTNTILQNKCIYLVTQVKLYFLSLSPYTWSMIVLVPVIQILKFHSSFTLIVQYNLILQFIINKWFNDLNKSIFAT